MIAISQAISGHLRQLGFIINKFYEKETNTNKKIGVEV
jgi:hypothetical protein